MMNQVLSVERNQTKTKNLEILAKLRKLMELIETLSLENLATKLQNLQKLANVNTLQSSLKVMS